MRALFPVLEHLLCKKSWAKKLRKWTLSVELITCTFQAKTLRLRDSSASHVLNTKAFSKTGPFAEHLPLNKCSLATQAVTDSSLTDKWTRQLWYLLKMQAGWAAAPGPSTGEAALPLPMPMPESRPLLSWVVTGSSSTRTTCQVKAGCVHSNLSAGAALWWLSWPQGNHSASADAATGRPAEYWTQDHGDWMTALI